MEPDGRTDEIERVIRQLDESLTSLRHMAREVDEEGNPNLSWLKDWATKALLRTRAQLVEGSPDATHTLVEMAFKDPSKGKPTTAEARADARQWLIFSGFLSQEELTVLSQTEALEIMQDRLKGWG